MLHYYTIKDIVAVHESPTQETVEIMRHTVDCSCIRRHIAQDSKVHLR